MPLYNNGTKDSAIASVEFSPLPEGNLTFVKLRDPVQKDAIRRWLTSAEVGQQIIAESLIDDQPILITQGKKSQAEVLGILQARGDVLKLNQPKHKTDLWKWRGTMGTVGQLGQLASAFLVMPDAMGARKVDHATLMFAVSNLLANGINIAFGAEKQDDKHQLHYLKEKFNHDLKPYLAAGQSLPSTDGTRAALRKESEKPKSLYGKFHDFMQHNSVWLGEIGLRYFGSFALAFPITNRQTKQFSFKGWGDGLKKLSKLDLPGAYDVAHNKDNIYSLAGGLTYLTGKSIAFTSKIPDPYDPRPHTMLDTVREHVTFHLSSLIEMCAGSTIAYDRLSLSKNPAKPYKLMLPELKVLGQFSGMKFKRDWFGGIGGLLFASAYLTRFFAPFGEKRLDIEELKAHVTDSLARMPADQIPQLLADCASTIKEHVKGKPVEFGQIYTQMLSDLYRYHHISLKNMPPTAIDPAAAPAEKGTQNATTPKTVLAPNPREHAAVQSQAVALSAAR